MDSAIANSQTNSSALGISKPPDGFLIVLVGEINDQILKSLDENACIRKFEETTDLQQLIKVTGNENPLKELSDTDQRHAILMAIWLVVADWIKSLEEDFKGIQLIGQFKSNLETRSFSFLSGQELIAAKEVWSYIRNNKIGRGSRLPDNLQKPGKTAAAFEKSLLTLQKDIVELYGFDRIKKGGNIEEIRLPADFLTHQQVRNREFSERWSAERRAAFRSAFSSIFQGVERSISNTKRGIVVKGRIKRKPILTIDQARHLLSLMKLKKEELANDNFARQLGRYHGGTLPGHAKAKAADDYLDFLDRHFKKQNGKGRIFYQSIALPSSKGLEGIKSDPKANTFDNSDETIFNWLIAIINNILEYNESLKPKEVSNLLSKINDTSKKVSCTNIRRERLFEILLSSWWREKKPNSLIEGEASTALAKILENPSKWQLIKKYSLTALDEELLTTSGGTSGPLDGFEVYYNMAEEYVAVGVQNKVFGYLDKEGRMVPESPDQTLVNDFAYLDGIMTGLFDAIISRLTGENRYENLKWRALHGFPRKFRKRLAEFIDEIVICGKKVSFFASHRSVKFRKTRHPITKEWIPNMVITVVNWEAKSHNVWYAIQKLEKYGYDFREMAKKLEEVLHKLEDNLLSGYGKESTVISRLFWGIKEPIGKGYVQEIIHRLEKYVKEIIESQFRGEWIDFEKMCSAGVHLEKLMTINGHKKIGELLGTLRQFRKEYHSYY
ncbi:MAG: hypothetical protein ACFFGZ_14675 [Candidatus Thorarchaeota archaeon]